MANNTNSANVPEIISDHARILSIIGRLFRRRADIIITLSDSKIRSKSIILDLNPQTGRFLLNKFQPEYAHNKFLEAKICYTRSQLDGIEIRFSTRLVKTVTEDDDTYYLNTLPDKIDYHQRRALHRISLSHEEIIPVTITLEDSTTLEGQLDDISAGGMSVLFPDDLPASIQIATPIRQCIFQIPAGELIACELEVRFINHGHDTSLPKIGARFINMEKSLEKKLQQFVMSMERRQAKEITTE